MGERNLRREKCCGQQFLATDWALTQGKGKIGLNQQMVPFLPPGLRQTYYTPTNTQPQSITVPGHVRRPTAGRDGYIFSHACVQTYLCVADVQAAGGRVGRGGGGGAGGLANGGDRNHGESAARIGPFTSEGEGAACLPEMTGEIQFAVAPVST